MLDEIIESSCQPRHCGDAAARRFRPGVASEQIGLLVEPIRNRRRVISASSILLVTCGEV
jgi:hypothetical protein